MSRSSSLPSPSSIFAEGQEVPALSAEVTALLETAGWTLDAEQIGLRKTYWFKTYTKVLDFHHIIGVRSKSKNHHPEMATKTGSLTVYWTTHHPRGLTVKDTFMARYCDEQARLVGDVQREEGMKCGPEEKTAGTRMRIQTEERV